ncbi:hypothetical protein C8R43DRAFT_951982 [Mycena crocata]|nr:hypothetical protein C8R43DRAFT_951982 [Mycena crocata]
MFRPGRHRIESEADARGRRREQEQTQNLKKAKVGNLNSMWISRSVDARCYRRTVKNNWRLLNWCGLLSRARITGSANCIAVDFFGVYKIQHKEAEKKGATVWSHSDAGSRTLSSKYVKQPQRAINFKQACATNHVRVLVCILCLFTTAISRSNGVFVRRESNPVIPAVTVNRHPFIAGRLAPRTTFEVSDTFCIRLSREDFVLRPTNSSIHRQQSLQDGENKKGRREYLVSHRQTLQQFEGAPSSDLIPQRREPEKKYWEKGGSNANAGNRTRCAPRTTSELSQTLCTQLNYQNLAVAHTDRRTNPSNGREGGPSCNLIRQPREPNKAFFEWSRSDAGSRTRLFFLECAMTFSHWKQACTAHDVRVLLYILYLITTARFHTEVREPIPRTGGKAPHRAIESASAQNRKKKWEKGVISNAGNRTRSENQALEREGLKADHRPRVIESASAENPKKKWEKGVVRTPGIEPGLFLLHDRTVGDSFFETESTDSEQNRLEVVGI